MMETNEVKSDESRRGVRSHSGLGAPEKIALTTLILFFGVSAFVYVAHHGAHIVAGFLKSN